MSSTTFNTLAVSKNPQKVSMDAALTEDVAMEIEAGGHGIQFKRSAELLALFGIFFTWL